MHGILLGAILGDDARSRFACGDSHASKRRAELARSQRPPPAGTVRARASKTRTHTHSSIRRADIGRRAPCACGPARTIILRTVPSEPEALDDEQPGVGLREAPQSA
jgi:hypothetical protein